MSQKTYPPSAASEKRSTKNSNVHHVTHQSECRSGCRRGENVILSKKVILREIGVHWCSLVFIGVNWFLGTAVGSAEQTRGLIYGMRALAPHCEYHKAQSCNKQNSLSMFGSALRISGEKPDSDLRTEHGAGAHAGSAKQSLDLCYHFAASVSDSTYLVH